MVKENLIKRKLKTDLQRYLFKAIPQGFSSTSGIKHWGLGGYASVLPRIKVCCRVIVTYSVIPNDFIPLTVGCNYTSENNIILN